MSGFQGSGGFGGGGNYSHGGSGTSSFDGAGGGGFGGRGGRGGRGRGGRGRGGRGTGRGDHGNSGGEQELYRICQFFTQGKQCRNGDKCQFFHGIRVAYSFKASEKSVSSMSTVDVGDGKTRIITGGEEPCVKVWNLTTDPPSTDMVMNTNGAVTHTEVNGSNIMWSIEEPLAGDAPGVPVGMVHLLDIGSQTTLPVKRSEDMPYTHPQPVRSIAIAIDNNIPYVVTAGTEGNIMCWRFEGGQFVKLSLCEGHTRAVTCLLFHEGMLWSGAGDRTLRVWDITSGRCVGTIKSAPGNSDGHADAVSCLEKIPAVAGAQDASSYVASGSIDGELKLWRPSGEFVYSCNNGAGITALRCFQDELGGQQSLLIGLFDGSMRIRSCATMALLVKLDSTLCRTQTIWSIADLGGRSCFASGGADGQCIMWQVCAPLRDSNSS